jgi:hypothetical protein
MYRRRGLSNLLKMGHCAPSVMQTILDLGNTKEEWLVRMTAGLMAVGLLLGEIEDSYLRVIRMLGTMIAGGNALADHMNKFNRVMNIGKRMSKWFTKEFGSTLCREVTQCDFSSLGNVHRYIEEGSVTTCKIIAEKVARQAERIIIQKGVGF